VSAAATRPRSTWPKIVNRLTFFGALSLGLLAIVPIIAQVFITPALHRWPPACLSWFLSRWQTLRAVESRALMVTYDNIPKPDFFMTPKARLTPLLVAAA